MKINMQHFNKSWEDMLAEIIEKREVGLDPVLVTRGEDLGKLNSLRSYLQARDNTLLIKLGVTCPLAYIVIEILLAVDPTSGQSLIKNLSRDAMIHLNSVVKNVPQGFCIVIDNCHLLEARFLFRVLRLINELEGRALMVFLFAEDEFTRWMKDARQIPHTSYFFKIVNELPQQINV